MLGVTAYSVLMCIVNILLGILLTLGIIQQGKSVFGISTVMAWLFFVISLLFFLTGGFVEFFTKLGLSISPVVYLVIAIYSMFEMKDLASLNIRSAMRKGILFSIILIAFLVIDALWVKNAVYISSFSIGWSYVVTLIFGIKNRNLE
ncbi:MULTISPECIES: hypothetical protein [unclassified Thermosipho (in: thermotogales)]|uniref:hypothetical protein n=1 Tax=unclassified Thermosipho (in: thermotogales) TaxID=2676525 RepID=UPI000985FD16|nr:MULTISPECIES: hypothetical protein [unclassified Thermosipho (in: thermotogales)]MBT1248740.1 hypothetical protein [Thermosipho sp. 1244]OOC47667.1 hypothetical protein XO09_00120 [Thermosipho sp. 1223]